MGKTRFSLFIPLLLVAAFIQVIFRNPVLSVFAFPVNAAIVLLLFGGLYVFNKEYAANRFLVALASGRTAVSAIVLTGMAGLVMLFFPSLAFQKSWIFDAVLLLLVSNLFLALLRYVILLVPLALILPRVTGSVFGIYAAEPIGDVLASATTLTLFLTRRKKLLPVEE